MSAEAFWFLRALLSPCLSPSHTEHQIHLLTFSLARLWSFLSPVFSLPFMNDSLSQYCPSDLHGYLAVLVRTTSPQHIFSPQVQTPPGLPRQLQAHLGEIPPGQERLDPLRSSSSRSLWAARQHESQDRRRAEQQRFHWGGGEFSLFCSADKNFSSHGSRILQVKPRLSRLASFPVMSRRDLKGPNRRKLKEHFTKCLCFF